MILKSNKILIPVLAISLIATGVLFYKNDKIYNEKLEEQNHFKLQNKIYQSQLSEIISKYDSVLIANNNLKQNNEEIVQQVTSSQKKLNKYTNDTSLNGKILNLKFENKNLEEAIEVLENNIKENNKVIATLEIKNDERIPEKVVKHNQLIAKNVNARGVRVMSDLYKKSKDKKIQELRVCFTLEGNEFIGEGNKKIYIQIVNPNGQVISPLKSALNAPDGEIKYSDKLDAFYNQKDTDVCSYVDLEKNKTIKGTYTINLFYDYVKIGSTTYDYH